MSCHGQVRDANAPIRPGGGQQPFDHSDLRGSTCASCHVVRSHLSISIESTTDDLVASNLHAFQPVRSEAFGRQDLTRTDAKSDSPMRLGLAKSFDDHFISVGQKLSFFAGWEFDRRSLGTGNGIG